MAEPKPAKIPIWNTSGANRTEPPAATPAPSKATGWALNDEPPSSYFNWLQYYTGAWFTWLDERVLDGVGEHDLIINALTPNAAGDGGDVTISAGGPNGPGAGGLVQISGADGTSQGGNANLFSGSSTGTGNAGNIGITAGASVGNRGGDVFVTGGPSDDSGGFIQLRGGLPTGTDLAGGNLRIRTGDGTGTKGATIDLRVSEAGAVSNAVPNTAVDYIVLNGATGAKDITVSRYTSVADAADTTRGVMRMVPKAQPTGGVVGEIYPDSATGQIAFQDGARYYNLNTIVKNISDDEARGLTPTSVASTTVVINEWPYPAGPVNSTPIRHIIPANSLRDGSIIRVRAQFFLDDLGGSTPVPSPGVFVGSIGAGPSPYTSPTGIDLLPVTRGSNVYDIARCEVELRVRSLGAPGACDYSWFGIYQTSSGARPVEANTVAVTPTIDTTVAQDVFPVCKFGSDVGYQMWCYQFVVEVI